MHTGIKFCLHVLHQIFHNYFLDDLAKVGQPSNLRSLADFGLVTFGTGVTDSILRKSGQTPSAIQSLIRLARGSHSMPEKRLRTLVGMSFLGTDLLAFKELIVSATSSKLMTGVF